MRNHFTVYYKGEPLPLPSGDIPSHSPPKDPLEGSFIYESDDMVILDRMSRSEFDYYDRLLRVSDYSEEEYSEREVLLSELRESNELIRSFENPNSSEETLDFFSKLRLD